MEILSGISAFLSIFDIVFSIIQKGELRSKEEIDTIKQFLTETGGLLKEVANDLEQNRYPHEKCSIMFEYMNGMKAVLQDRLKEDEINRLQELIEQSYRIEQLLGQLNSLTFAEKSYNIDMMRSISGTFIGIAQLMGV